MPPFKSDKTLAVILGTAKYDKVLTEDGKGGYRQVMPDIPQVERECIDMREFLDHYNIVNERDIYRLDDGPTHQEV